MSGDFETLENNQPKITYLKPEDNTEWLEKLINKIEDMKNNISKDSQSSKIGELFLIQLFIFLLLIQYRFFLFNEDRRFLMNMCVLVLGLLVRREIKLKKARQIMKTQVF